MCCAYRQGLRRILAVASASIAMLKDYIFMTGQQQTVDRKTVYVAIEVLSHIYHLVSMLHTIYQLLNAVRIVRPWLAFRCQPPPHLFPVINHTPLLSHRHTFLTGVNVSMPFRFSPINPTDQPNKQLQVSCAKTTPTLVVERKYNSRVVFIPRTISEQN